MTTYVHEADDTMRKREEYSTGDNLGHSLANFFHHRL